MIESLVKILVTSSAIVSLSLIIYLVLKLVCVFADKEINVNSKAIYIAIGYCMGAKGLVYLLGLI